MYYMLIIRQMLHHCGETSTLLVNYFAMAHKLVHVVGVMLKTNFLAIIGSHYQRDHIYTQCSIFAGITPDRMCGCFAH